MREKAKRKSWWEGKIRGQGQVPLAWGFTSLTFSWRFSTWCYFLGGSGFSFIKENRIFICIVCARHFSTHFTYIMHWILTTHQWLKIFLSLLLKISVIQNAVFGLVTSCEFFLSSPQQHEKWRVAVYKPLIIRVIFIPVK